MIGCGCKVKGVEFRIWFRVSGLGFRDSGSGWRCRFKDSAFRVEGLGLGV